MKFTHINVCKYNYCFSDHPFPQATTDYPHQEAMFDYIKSYVDKHSLEVKIQFNSEVLQVEGNINLNYHFNSILNYTFTIELSKDNDFYQNLPDFDTIKRGSYDKLWQINVKNTETNKETKYITPYLCIASGHHGTPLNAKFKGLETFPGKVIHSVSYKSATINKLQNQKVLLVGIGNSSVDAAVNLVNEGNNKGNVVISTRSGSWIIPNYVNGYPTDLYACRLFLGIPWYIGSTILEMIIKGIYGHPKKYNLNPKMRALQSQPTVSPTLVHHIQRNDIKIKPNVSLINGSRVTFENGEEEQFDSIIMCTGFKIGLDFLGDNLKNRIFTDKDYTHLNVMNHHAFLFNFVKILKFINNKEPNYDPDPERLSMSSVS
jgi:dimethylaniline monooxygenase (N-oxide forming)